MSPFYELLRKNTKFVWSCEQQNAFIAVKKALREKPVLKLFDPRLPTALECDASSKGVGAVLLQKYPGCWLPVEFASRTLNQSEQNYSQIERESLSVVFGCEKFRHFLLGSKFLLKNDHKPLLKIFSRTSGMPQHCSARIQRWILRLSHFNFDFQFIKGIDNVTSDFLSRFPSPKTASVEEPYDFIFVMTSLNDALITWKDIKLHTSKDSDLQSLKSYIRCGFPANIAPNLSEFISNSHDLSIFSDCILYRNRVFIPQSLRTLVLNQLHKSHPGVSAMKSIVRALIWYPGVDSDVTDLVKNCVSCQQALAKPAQNCHTQWPQPHRPWSRVHVDHFFFEGKTFLLVVDSLSKYIECEIVKNTSSSETIDTLMSIFSRNGLPDLLVSDNATSFKSDQFSKFLEAHAITHRTSPAYEPASNGQAERCVRTIKDLLRKNKVGSLRYRLSNALLHYRNVPHSVTKHAPSVSLNGHTLITVREKLNPYYVAETEEPGKNITLFQPGDTVLALNMREGEKWQRGTIVDRLGTNVYNVHVPSLNVIWKRHKHQMVLLQSFH